MADKCYDLCFILERELLQIRPVGFPLKHDLVVSQPSAEPSWLSATVCQFVRQHTLMSVCYGPNIGPNSSSNSSISSAIDSSSAFNPASVSSRTRATDTISTSALIALLKALIIQSFNSFLLNRSLHLPTSRHKSYSGTVANVSHTAESIRVSVSLVPPLSLSVSRTTKTKASTAVKAATMAKMKIARRLLIIAATATTSFPSGGDSLMHSRGEACEDAVELGELLDLWGSGHAAPRGACLREYSTARRAWMWRGYSSWPMDSLTTGRWLTISDSLRPLKAATSSSGTSFCSSCSMKAWASAG